MDMPHHSDVERADDGTAEKGTAGEVRVDTQVGGRDLTRWNTRLGQWLVDIVERTGLALGLKKTLVLILALGAGTATLMTWLASEVYESVVEADGVARLDHPLLRMMLRLRSPALDELATDYTNIGGVVIMPILAAATMAALALIRRSWTPVILITAAGAGSLLMTIAGKQLLGRARPSLADAVPPYEHSASFPSGHTLNATVIAGVVAYLLVLRQHRRFSRVLTVLAATLFAFTIGVSRVFLGHHWFTDVLAAWALGAGWLAAVITAHRLYLSATPRVAAINGSDAQASIQARVAARPARDDSSAEAS